MISKSPAKHIILLLVGIAFGVRTFALSVIPPSFEQLVQQAQTIGRVEVIAIECREDASAEHGLVMRTYVTCRVLKLLKGQPAAQITLRFLGGRIGDRGFMIPDMPTFHIGQRAIVFVENNGSQFCPLVGIMHGRYHLVRDPQTGMERVLRNNGEPLLKASDANRAMAHDAHPVLIARAASTAMAVEDFEADIIRELLRSHAHSR